MLQFYAPVILLGKIYFVSTMFYQEFKVHACEDMSK